MALHVGISEQRHSGKVLGILPEINLYHLMYLWLELKFFVPEQIVPKDLDVAMAKPIVLCGLEYLGIGELIEADHDRQSVAVAIQIDPITRHEHDIEGY